jgi:hypothetical protein
MLSFKARLFSHLFLIILGLVISEAEYQNERFIATTPKLLYKNYY